VPSATSPPSREAGATDSIGADLCDTGTILTQAAGLLDFTRPVAVTLMAVLYAIPDSDGPFAIVADLMDAVPSGSYLALTHSASDLLGTEQRQGLEDVNSRMIHPQFTYHSREQVAGLRRVPDLPGFVWCARGRVRS
jgi:hypothetical protein